MTPRDIEKLRAIGFDLPYEDRNAEAFLLSTWDRAKAHVQSPAGMKATMADKVAALPAFLGDVKDVALHHANRKWQATLTTNGQTWAAYAGSEWHLYGYDSPEAAVDALFWAVP